MDSDDEIQSILNTRVKVIYTTRVKEHKGSCYTPEGSPYFNS